MLPILTSLIVRDSKGVKAWMIALTFVSSMAAVYAVLGLIASSAGLNFQRWLQQPGTLIAFSVLFVLFALNLFGLFEIKLPQRLVQRLDRAQAMQQGGSLVSAGVMGMISALLVGPCMTAPLAGALLFISQTQSQWQGALLLFTLGFGMGTPLLLASALCLYHAGAGTVFYSPTDFRSDFTVVILRLGHGLCDLCTVPDFLASYRLEVVIYPVSGDSAALYQSTARAKDRD